MKIYVKYYTMPRDYIHTRIRNSMPFRVTEIPQKRFQQFTNFRLSSLD